MKRIFILFLLIEYSAQSQDNGTMLEKAASFALFNSKDFSLDLKFIDPAKGSFGIDYKFQLVRSLANMGSDSFKNINFALGSRGFVTVIGDKNQSNSIINELKFEAFPLFRVPPKKLPGDGDWRDRIDDEELDPDEDPLIIESRRLAQQASSPLWVFFNIHGKHETSQDFKKYDFAFGTQLSVTTSFLNAILDFPFGILRVSKNNNPRQLDLSIAYDYVLSVDKSDLKNLINENHLNRLNFRAEWETGIFTGRDRLVFYFDSYKHLNPTVALKASGKEWNNFLMVRLDHLLMYNKQTKTLMKVSIKYTTGELPPNFNTGHVLGGGFSLEF